jgi:hypothetical protein
MTQLPALYAKAGGCPPGAAEAGMPAAATTKAAAAGRNKPFAMLLVPQRSIA